ncbi:MAG: SPOR domain-containing protein [Spirulinaceae cyanobacterium]
MSSSSPRHTTRPSELPPPLEVALSSLDVQLEAELARYRRHRLHQHVAPSPPAETPAAAPTEANAVGQNNDVVNLTQSTAPAAQRSAEPTASQSANSEPPQDYLQSSEQLLKTLDKTPKSALKTTKQPQLTGWYVGAAALLIVAAALVGISWQQSRLQVTQQPAAETDANTPMGSPATPTEDAAQEPLDIDGPNLAEPPNGEAASDAPPAPPSDATAQPQPSPAASPTLPGREPDLASALLPESPPAQSAPPNGAPENTTFNPANIAPPPPANDRRYFVVVDYLSETDLVRARTGVSEAYPRRFANENKIQMGVFENPADAQALVNRLQGQGIVAKVHQPTQ